MVKNFVQPGKTIDYLNNAAALVPSGGVIPSRDRIFIAAHDIAPGEKGSANLEGVFKLPKKNGEPFNQGDPLYWDAGAGELTNVARNNTHAGICFEDAEAGALFALVRLEASTEAAFKKARKVNLIGRTPDLNARNIFNLRNQIEKRLDQVEQKTDEVIKALQTAGLMED